MFKDTCRLIGILTGLWLNFKLSRDKLINAAEMILTGLWLNFKLSLQCTTFLKIYLFLFRQIATYFWQIRTSKTHVLRQIWTSIKHHFKHDLKIKNRSHVWLSTKLFFDWIFYRCNARMSLVTHLALSITNKKLVF